jgi:[ribosomal protein S5]-alanine N-acetyltransferase
MDFIFSLFRGPPQRAHPSLDMHLVGPRVILRLAKTEDWKDWHALRELSRNTLEMWEPEWPQQALTYGYYCSLLRRTWRDWRGGKAYAFAIFRRGEAQQMLIGGITLSDIQYAAAQKGTVGYWMGLPYVRKGYMTEALGLVCDFAFTKLKLQRIEASCLPNNEPSKALLRRCGFEEEGYAKSYLQIRGKREDHLLWGKNNKAPEKQN